MPVWPPYGTATTLLDGRILLVQGEYASLVDPRGRVTDSPVRVPAPQVVRVQHTATRLDDGRVLLAGGFDPRTGAPVRPCEFFVGNQFVPGPEIRFARVRPQALLLRDGRMLMLGGSENWSTPEIQEVERAEVFDLRSERWAVAAALVHPRLGSAAAVMGDGAVLVTGGTSRGVRHCSASCEFYDPVRDAFVPGPSLVIGRTDHAACRFADLGVVLCGGSREAESELFEESSQRFRRLPGTARWELGPAMVDWHGELHIVGPGQWERIENN